MPRARSNLPAPDLFMQRVSKTAGCWLWRGPVDRDGYGDWQYAEKRSRAHRWAYELFVGPIPVGMFICHTCDTPACVRPDHLFAGSQKDNMQDMLKKGRKAPKTGEHHHMAILTEAQVRAIRAADDGRRGTPARIAKEFGLNYQTVSDVLRGRRWGHLS